MGFEIENKMHALYARKIIVRIACCEHSDGKDFSAEFQLIGQPETKRSTPRMFSIIEALEWIEKQTNDYHTN